MRTDDSDAVFAEAEEAFSAGQFLRAGELWSTLANDPDALYNAANSYREAGMVANAKTLYRRAIDGGVREAYLNLAYILEDEGHRETAADLLASGARAGDPGASVELAYRFVDQDPTKARNLALPFRADALVGEYAKRIIGLAEQALLRRD